LLPHNKHFKKQKNKLSEIIKTPQDEYFFDRNSEYFSMILDYLRGNKFDMKRIKNEVDFFREFEYYQIQIDSDDYELQLKHEVIKKQNEAEKRKKRTPKKRKWK